MSSLVVLRVVFQRRVALGSISPRVVARWTKDVWRVLLVSAEIQLNGIEQVVAVCSLIGIDRCSSTSFVGFVLFYCSTANVSL
jgi:hypothetical protein